MSPAQLVLELAPPPAPTLANFVAGRNGAALAALRAAAAGAPSAHVIFLWGERGSGRSHLIRAAAAAGLTSADDVESLSAEEQIALFDAIDAARIEGTCVVASGARPPAVTAVREDLRTRLGAGLAFELVALDEAEQTLALKAHAAARGIALGDEVIAYLHTRVRRDMGTLMAVLEALDRYSLANHRAITLPMVRAALAHTP